MEKPIIPACYLPPVSYFATVLRCADRGLLLEQHEHFPKQTYRNRATIYGANGALDLIIPVRKGRASAAGEGQSHPAVHTKMKDVQISYEADWQRLHWMSLQTAYRSSAYFEYYEDEFAPFYRERYTHLFDFNKQLTQLILGLLKIEVTLTLTEEYLAECPPARDLRGRFTPKRRSGESQTPERPNATPEYHQVFADRHGFLPNLSVVDLLFNAGPQSGDYLREWIAHENQGL